MLKTAPAGHIAMVLAGFHLAGGAAGRSLWEGCRWRWPLATIPALQLFYLCTQDKFHDALLIVLPKCRWPGYVTCHIIQLSYPIWSITYTQTFDASKFGSTNYQMHLGVAGSNLATR
jgi:hypothetical protein